MCTSVHEVQFHASNIRQGTVTDLDDKGSPLLIKRFAKLDPGFDIQYAYPRQMPQWDCCYRDGLWTTSLEDYSMLLMNSVIGSLHIVVAVEWINESP